MPNGVNATTDRADGNGAFRPAFLFLLFAGGAVVENVRLSSLHNPDVWLHLRLGEWILANKIFPTTGLFSQAVNLTWRDYSWAADAATGVAYRLLGLSAVPALWMAYRVVLAVVTFLLAGGSRNNFLSPSVVSVVAQYLLYGLGPIASGISTVLFGVELLALLLVRRTGTARRLLWLPVLFVLWANLDLAFVYGMGVLALFLTVLWVEEIGSSREIAWLGRPPSELRVSKVAFVGIASLTASLVSPYGYHSYSTFLAVQSSPANQYLSAHTAMSFHRPHDYVLLLLTMASFLSLGLRRSRDLFLLSTLTVCTALAFHAQGANWLAILAAVSVIGGLQRTNLKQASKSSARWFLLPAAASLAVAALSFVVFVPRGYGVLLNRIAVDFPVRASDYIRQRQLPAPLFNSYLWGGFLSWYLPDRPVAIDARRGLYSEELETNYFRVMKVMIPYQELAPLKEARTVLLDKQGVMAGALRELPGFQVAYEDDIAIVLVQQTHEQSSLENAWKRRP